VIEDEAELDSFYEKEMPGPKTAALFEEARKLNVDFYLGYAELAREGNQKRRFNTSILVDRNGAIVGKYRKVHLPGHSEPQPNRKHQHLEKLFRAWRLRFPGLARPFRGGVGMCICNDRRWPDAYRVVAFRAAKWLCSATTRPTTTRAMPTSTA
jgi:N-carbamoyl-D-amino-acid hydrolase